MSPTEYARGVVAAIATKSAPAWFWHGNATLLIRSLDMFFPRTIFVCLILFTTPTGTLIEMLTGKTGLGVY